MSETTEQLACSHFRQTFGYPPRWLASAPGRVNLIGEFTDFNGGFVLPMAIEQRTAIAAAPNRLDEIVVRSEATNETVLFDVQRPLSPEPRGRWSNYVKGVLAGFVGAGWRPTGFNAVVTSSVPMGAGLSSSAALESATALLLSSMGHPLHLDLTQIATLCQRAEHEYAQVPCGIMDQFISLMGRNDHVLLLDCQSNSPTWIRWADPGVAVLVVNTNVKHKLSTSQYAVRRLACENAARAMGVASLRVAELDMLREHTAYLEEDSLRCARHVLTENHRTRQAALCVREGDWSGFGHLLYASHESLRADYQVTCKELDLVVDIAKQIGIEGGVYGARMTGGGFGGCVIALVRASLEGRISEAIAQGYRRQVGFDPSIFVARPSNGATACEIGDV
jgi:galactokinase